MSEVKSARCKKFRNCTCTGEFLTLEKGNFIFKASTVITVEDTAMVSVAEQFASLFNVPAGFTPQVKTTAKAGDVCLRFDSSLKKRSLSPGHHS